MALLIKEILALLKDPKTRLVLIVPPILQLFIFAFAATLDVQNVRIGILNRDGGEKSIEFVQRFIGAKTFSHIQFLQSVDDVDPFVDRQEGLLVVSIDETFSRDIDSRRPTSVQIILDGRKTNSAQIAAGYVSRIIEQFNQDVSSLVGYALQPSTVVSRSWFNPNLLYYWYNIPCLVVILTTSVGLIVTALSVAREREMGTFDQLLVSPLSQFEIVIGKMAPAVLIALSEASIIVLCGIFVFNIPFSGSFWLLYAALFVFVCSIVGVGLFISSLCATQQQAILGTFCFMSPSILLSGFATPIENMPEWLQYCTYILPLRYMLVVSKGIFLKAMPFSMVVANAWPMALIAVGTLTLSSWLFRRRLE